MKLDLTQEKLFSYDPSRLYFLLQFRLLAFGLLVMLLLQMVLLNIYSKKKKKIKKNDRVWILE